MALINPKITLLIAEELGASDISCLMRTCKANCAIIKTYEKSISRARIRHMDLNLSYLLAGPILVDPILPIIAYGPILADPMRVFDRASFELVAALERRVQGADNIPALSMLLGTWLPPLDSPLSYL